MDIREYTSPTLPVTQFVERYVDTDHYDAGCGGVITTGRCGYVPPMISPSPATGADSGRCVCGACSSGSPRRSRPQLSSGGSGRATTAAVLPDGPADDPPAAGGVSPVGYPHRGRMPSVRALHPGRRAGPAGIRRASAIRWSLWAATCPLRRSSCWAGRFCGAGRDACRSIWRWSAAC